MSELEPYIRKVVATPPALTPADLGDAIGIIIEHLANESEPNVAVYVPIAGFLAALRATKLDHKAEYIAAAAKAVLKHSDVVANDATNVSDNEVTIDIVGTGGDGQNTFNVSTSSAIVAAGIPGVKVCKHGGRASTSNSGAGDLIAVLGCDPSKVTARTVPHLWARNSFLFLLAPYFHNGMKHVALMRKLLKMPTIFNVLGPLLHPVPTVHKRVLGVFSRDLGPEYARAAAIMYPDSETYVVWGHVGLDEVSPTGVTTVWHTVPGCAEPKTFDVTPELFGLREHTLADCASLGPEQNAVVLRKILGGAYRKGQDPIYDYVLLNTATLYCLVQGNQDWPAGVVAAEQSIHSGEAREALEHFLADVDRL
ncbi:LAMI_0E13300g1_1 [Lachancea mirantina]|uniref:LAMI_0E13300g1_1 n=1 Tax=Lachancea mirantina TaxID=1230905 RepID=A0A1G4JR40_9SACH|nr:LAMI_0E13300g1_1 [Lachancea mirantina]